MNLMRRAFFHVFVVDIVSEHSPRMRILIGRSQICGYRTVIPFPVSHFGNDIHKSADFMKIAPEPKDSYTKAIPIPWCSMLASLWPFCTFVNLVVILGCLDLLLSSLVFSYLIIAEFDIIVSIVSSCS